MCVCVCVCVCVCKAILIVFEQLLIVRDAPSVASSLATDRDVSLISLLPSLVTLSKNFHFVFLVMIAGCSQGIFATWAGLMDLLLASEVLFLSFTSFLFSFRRIFLFHFEI
jgi:hypothetical protein